ncbi:hypothetical protein LTR86_003592 [Recurvomyces mirabilis]|nr:hypothetical protein LTR86_003592 [Recurvomyces mirabilis]
MALCKHTELWLDVSAHAKEAEYMQQSSQQRVAATQASGRCPKETASSPAFQDAINAATFPLPLVLPGDELAWDPKCSPQSFRSWKREKHRHAVTNRRRTVYVMAPSTLAKDMGCFKPDTNLKPMPRPKLQSPTTTDVIDYLQSFYHGMPVKVLDAPKSELVPWYVGEGSKDKSTRIGLNVGGEIVGIRVRWTELFAVQLNLNDLLDAAISILPDDAYALLMLVDHDLYEDEEDDFCCGRAYGGSRVAVVSTARYNPRLDETHDVDREHAWPASHCRAYVEECCARDGKKSKKRKLNELEGPVPADNPMSSALAAHIACKTKKDMIAQTAKIETLWLGRVCKTASHELGHCFGIGHCTYYACVMQGTARLPEDARQPPYLCPIDTAKLLHATGAKEADWIRALMRFCRRFPDDRLFRAFAAWLGVRIQAL